MISSGLLKAQGKKAGDKLNIALVGIGAEGEVLLNSILKLPNLNIVAVCDIWEYRRKYGFIRIFKELKQKAAQYEDYKDLIAKHAKELDAVVIATPDFWHAPMTVDFLEAGVNVYCEKMMSNTLEGAKSMVRAARKSGNSARAIRATFMPARSFCARLKSAAISWLPTGNGTAPSQRTWNGRRNMKSLLTSSRSTDTRIWRNSAIGAGTRVSAEELFPTWARTR